MEHYFKNKNLDDSFPIEWERALVIAAHPGDIEFSYSESIAKFTASGRRIVYVILTTAENETNDSNSEQIESETIKAAEAVGVREIHFMREPAGKLHKNSELSKDLKLLAADIKPELLIYLSKDAPSENENYNSDIKATTETIDDLLSSNEAESIKWVAKAYSSNSGVFIDVSELQENGEKSRQAYQESLKNNPYIDETSKNKDWADESLKELENFKNFNSLIPFEIREF